MKPILILISLLSISFCYSQTFTRSILIGKWKCIYEADTTTTTFLNDSACIINHSKKTSPVPKNALCKYEIVDFKENKFRLKITYPNNGYVISDCIIFDRDLLQMKTENLDNAAFKLKRID
jgi:hypothetical protein